jgi:hypothetical protein
MNRLEAIKTIERAKCGDFVSLQEMTEALFATGDLDPIYSVMPLDVPSQHLDMAGERYRLPVKAKPKPPTPAEMFPNRIKFKPWYD